jgi:hypothetical protein
LAVFTEAAVFTMRNMVCGPIPMHHGIARRRVWERGLMTGKCYHIRDKGDGHLVIHHHVILHA